MRAVLALIVLTLTAGSAAGNAPAPRPWSHVRPLSRLSAAVLSEATERSPIVRQLVEALERTDVVVYLADSWSASTGEAPGFLTFVSAAAGVRYLMVRMDYWRLSYLERVSLLGHELEHALEVAAAPEVRDDESLAALYRRIGWELAKGRFESASARAMGKRVRSGLAALH